MNLKRLLKTAVCGIACAAAVLSFTGCDKYSKMLKDDPEEYIGTVIENTAKEMSKGKNETISDVLSKASENGTFTIDFEVEGIKFSGELYADEKQDAMSQSYTIANNGQSAKIYIYGDKDGMKFGTIGQSGSHIYDMKFSNIKEKLAASIFNPDSDSYYAMDSETYSQFMEYAEEIAAAIGQEAKDSDKYENTVENYFKDNGRTVAEKVDTDIGGERVNANIITYVLTKEELKELTEQIMENYDGKDIDKEDAMNEIMESFDKLDDCCVNITFYVNSKTHVLMRAEVNADITASGESTVEMYADILLGADPANAKEQSIRFGVSNDEEEAYYLISSSREENGSSLTITETSGGETEQLVKLSTTLDGDSYTVSADISDYSLGINGTLTYDDSSVNVTVDSVSFGSFSYAPSAEVSVRKGGEILKLDAEKEFLDITEDELTELIENIQSDISGIFE